MSRRIPILPTIIVLAAALLMVRLGFWQLQRLHEKEALLARYSANVTKPPLPFAALFPVTEETLYRRTSAYCLDVLSWKTEAGRGADGRSGWRHIASCRTGAEGPGFAVQIGTTRDVDFKPNWTGGKVSGLLSHAPSNRPLIARLFGKAPPQPLLLVADKPAPGLSANGVPSIESIPNNHLAYAVQWFLFAGIAGIIYVIAVQRRMTPPPVEVAETPPSR